MYWNSRLQSEHRRLIQVFKKGDTICKHLVKRIIKNNHTKEMSGYLGDVMAGVGPFSVPAAKKGAHVYCNDLNPESYKWLCENIKLNKV